MITVFTTNVATEADSKQLATILARIPGIKKLSFDLENHDKVLRLESEYPVVLQTITCLKENGYDCKEMPDN
jgi:hypothetical protein